MKETVCLRKDGISSNALASENKAHTLLRCVMIGSVILTQY